MPFTIRALTRDDLESLSVLIEKGDEFHRAALPDVFKRPEGPARERQYLDWLVSNDEGLVVVADVGAGLAGFVQVCLRRAPVHPVFVDRVYAVIENLFVESAYRGQGIGSALIRRAEDWARSRGIEEVELHVWQFNTTAIDLYRKLGYETLGLRMGVRTDHRRSEG